jgi:endonuclease/exonuclease/phosphatase family metal-dependent hydrolase
VNTKRPKTGLNLVTGILLLLNLIAATLLLLAYASFHFSPSFIPYIAFAGLAYPFILLLNLLFVVFWLLTRMRYALISLIVVIAGWNHIGRLMQLGSSSPPENMEKPLKILSYNIQNFLRINTSTTKYVTDFENESRIRKFIAEQDADIICLQEMLHDRDSHKKFLKEMARELDCPNFHHVNYYRKNTKVIDAIATFSKYPIVNKGDLEYEGKSIAIYTDLVTGKDTMRVYNLHLASIHFKQEDYEFWSEITNAEEQEKFTAGTGKILSKMQSAFLKRAGQTDTLLAHFKESPHPLIICGDFNDTPSSYAYNRLSRHRRDAFVESGSGLGITYAGEFFPAFRIDFILHDPTFQSASFMRHKIPFSDHYPISTYLYSN